MTKRDKMLAKLSNPEADGNWTLAEVTKLLESQGWTLDRVTGSHHIFGREQSPPIVVAAHGNSVKKGYLRQIRETLLE